MQPQGPNGSLPAHAPRLFGAPHAASSCTPTSYLLTPFPQGLNAHLADEHPCSSSNSITPMSSEFDTVGPSGRGHETANGNPPDHATDMAVEATEQPGPSSMRVLAVYCSSSSPAAEDPGFDPPDAPNINFLASRPGVEVCSPHSLGMRGRCCLPSCCCWQLHTVLQYSC
jgi:hypothetical protein